MFFYIVNIFQSQTREKNVHFAQKLKMKKNRETI